MPALDLFGHDRNSDATTVRGAGTLRLRSSGFYRRLTDEPPTWPIYFMGTRAPAVRFEIEAGS